MSHGTRHNPICRVEMDDTDVSAMAKLSEGNPGALVALITMHKKGQNIDPDAALGGVTASILSLDSLGIYGSQIHILWKYICREDVPKFMAVLRAQQLGIIDAGSLKKSCETPMSNTPQIVDAEQCLKSVIERLPKFNSAPPVAD